MFGGPSGPAGQAADEGGRGAESSGSDPPPGRGTAVPALAPQSAAEAAEQDNRTLHNRTKRRGGKRERRRIEGSERALGRGEELIPSQSLGRHGYTHFPDAADEEYVTKTAPHHRRGAVTLPRLVPRRAQA